MKGHQLPGEPLDGFWGTHLGQNEHVAEPVVVLLQAPVKQVHLQDRGLITTLLEQAALRWHQHPVVELGRDVKA